jgi:hypothetical protein
MQKQQGIMIDINGQFRCQCCPKNHGWLNLEVPPWLMGLWDCKCDYFQRAHAWAPWTNTGVPLLCLPPCCRAAGSRPPAVA